MPVAIALLPSPLLGVAALEPLAAALRDAGSEVVLADLPRQVTDPDSVLEAFVVQLAGRGDLTLVPHSNAGLFAPAVADRVAATATVFMDAALPAGGPTTALAPPGLRDLLGRLVDADGMLPPWTRWWGDEATALFPSEQWRRRVEQGQPRLPLSYFDATLPVPAGWERRACGYLAFGRTYAEEVARAGELGWPVRVLEGLHLHMLLDPAGVARNLLDLRDRTRSPGPG